MVGDDHERAKSWSLFDFLSSSRSECGTAHRLRVFPEASLASLVRRRGRGSTLVQLGNMLTLRSHLPYTDHYVALSSGDRLSSILRTSLGISTLATKGHALCWLQNV